MNIPTGPAHNGITDILCQSWHADSWDEHVILFEANGTGEVGLIGSQGLRWILAEL
jgi:hypothetical protein